MGKPRRVGWDACTWIATILQEKVPRKDGTIEDRAPACNYLIGQAQVARLEIATSGLSLAEVCKDPAVKHQDADVLNDFFRNPYIFIVPVDRYVGTKAREIMQDMIHEHPGLRPPDAIHLATAIIAQVTELHTFDRKLLNMDQKLEMPDKSLLRITKPPEPPAPVKLLI